MTVFLSESTDPYFHLAVEEWLLRNYQGQMPVWFIYRNQPCVVLGRFQNPWKECDLGWLAERKLPLVRRPSGGGTVWHDLGNVNFCCVRPLKGFTKDQALAELQEKLFRFGVQVEINARHDLVVRMTDESTRKVSGSAYKQTKDRALHHGTLLIDASLDDLERSLNSPVKLKSTKSIASVRSQVMNLMTTELTVESWMRSFGATEVVDETDARFDSAPWKSWSWRFGETPLFEWDFEVDGHSIRLSSHKGMIRQIEWSKLGLQVADLNRPLMVQTFADLLAERGEPMHRGSWEKILGGL